MLVDHWGLFRWGPWVRVRRTNAQARTLADRHYSRQSVGNVEFMPPGRLLVLLATSAVWGVCENLDPVGNLRWRCTIFRNESNVLSSDLIRSATEATYWFWAAHYRHVPERLTTEVDPTKTRRKRDPGRCFVRAGWEVLGEVRGLVILGAPLNLHAR